MNQLLCALRFYATGNHLLAVADTGGYSVATCSRIVKRVTEAIISLRDDFIQFPDIEAEQSKVKADFYRIARFPNVLGCIDCTHVKIQSPGTNFMHALVCRCYFKNIPTFLSILWYVILGGDDAELFRNRKSYMSINVQTISSADLLVRDVVARWPGSSHDSTIYQSSRRYAKFERGDYTGAYLLGDSGYPLKVTSKKSIVLYIFRFIEKHCILLWCDSK